MPENSDTAFDDPFQDRLGGTSPADPPTPTTMPDRTSEGPDESDEPVAIPESDEKLLAQCRVDTFRAGGKGGQHQNTTESGVRLVHRPTGVRAMSRDERSQHRNRTIALERLRDKLEQRNRTEAPRIRTRVPRKEKRKRLADKRHRGRIKKLRKPPPRDGTE